MQGLCSRKRRTWLGLVCGLFWSAGMCGAGVPEGAELADAELVDLPADEWLDPPVLDWRRGQRQLVAGVGGYRVRVGPRGEWQRVRLRTYNGSLVGPTIRFRAGDTLPIELVNLMPKTADDVCHEHHDPDRPFGYNLTNLHTHGLHISPSGISDNVLICVPPEGRQRYRFQVLPEGLPPGEPTGVHYPGTFWYHAHVHGSTAVQLASGMAGPLLLEGDIDRVPEIRAARDRTFVFQQLSFDAQGEVKSVFDIICNWRGAGGNCPGRHGLPKHTSINGRVKPKIELRPGQVERWRWIDAGVNEMLPISLEGHVLHQIAIDGITLPATRPVGEVEMGPGYRTDVMVKAADCPKDRQPCRFNLWKGKGRFSLTGETGPTLDNAQVLAVVEVAGEPCSAADPCATELPTKLPAPVDMLPDIHASELTNPGKPRRAEFSVDNSRPPTRRFLINGRTYHHEVHPDFQLKKGDVEEWLLTNTSSTPHPFHIHVNAFQIVDSQGRPSEWRDTVLVPPRQGGRDGMVRIRTRYERFTGKFVLHCHILTHEDLGMMQLVEVSEKGPISDEEKTSQSHQPAMEKDQ